MILPKLLKLLQQSDASMPGNDWFVRNNVVCGLRYYQDRAETVVPVLLKGMKDPDAKVRLMSAESLTYMGFEDAAKRQPQLMVAALLETLQFNDADTRSLSARALGKFGHAADVAVPALLKTLEDKDLGTRINATNALKHPS